MNRFILFLCISLLLFVIDCRNHGKRTIIIIHGGGGGGGGGHGHYGYHQQHSNINNKSLKFILELINNKINL
jgi:hypothetical protein